MNKRSPVVVFQTWVRMIGEEEIEGKIGFHGGESSKQETENTTAMAVIVGFRAVGHVPKKNLQLAHCSCIEKEALFCVLCMTDFFGECVDT